MELNYDNLELVKSAVLTCRQFVFRNPQVYVYVLSSERVYCVFGILMSTRKLPTCKGNEEREGERERETGVTINYSNSNIKRVKQKQTECWFQFTKCSLLW